MNISQLLGASTTACNLSELRTVDNQAASSPAQQGIEQTLAAVGIRALLNQSRRLGSANSSSISTSYTEEFDRTNSNPLQANSSDWERAANSRLVSYQEAELIDKINLSKSNFFPYVDAILSEEATYRITEDPSDFGQIETLLEYLGERMGSAIREFKDACANPQIACPGKTDKFEIKRVQILTILNSYTGPSLELEKRDPKEDLFFLQELAVQLQMPSIGVVISEAKMLIRLITTGHKIIKLSASLENLRGQTPNSHPVNALLVRSQSLPSFLNRNVEYQGNQSFLRRQIYANTSDSDIES